MTELTNATHLRRHQAIVADGVQTAFIFPIRDVRAACRGHRVAHQNHRSRISPYSTPLPTSVQSSVSSSSGSSSNQSERIFSPSSSVHGTRSSCSEPIERSLEQVASRMRSESWLTLPSLRLGTSASLTSSIRKIRCNPALGGRNANPTSEPLTDELVKHAPDLGGSHPAALAVRQRKSQGSADMSEWFMRSTTQETTTIR